MIVTFNKDVYASADNNKKITITENGSSTQYPAKNTQKFTFSGNKLTINHNLNAYSGSTSSQYKMTQLLTVLVTLMMLVFMP